MKWKLRVSSPTLNGIAKSASEYFYSKIEVKSDSKGGWNIENSKGVMGGYRVIFKKGRYRLEEEVS